MITIKEIASTLGVSTTTVSNVIHGKTREVSPKTVEKVENYLREVHYVPNINARNLAQNRSKIIGVVLMLYAYKDINIFVDIPKRCIGFLQSFRDFYIEKNNSERAQKYEEKLIYLKEHYPELFNVGDE